MFSTCPAVQYGTPVLYEVGHLQDYLSSCCGSILTHVADGDCVVRVCTTVPVACDLASPFCNCKSAATSALPTSSSHVLLFCNGSDSKDAVRHTVAQLLPGTRLTVFSAPAHCAQVMQGNAMLKYHGEVLLSAAVFTTLGFPPAFESSTPLGSSTGLPLFMLSVHTGILTVREKPLPTTCFDSFVQLNTSQVVNGLDLSSTCIEF